VALNEKERMVNNTCVLLTVLNIRRQPHNISALFSLDRLILGLHTTKRLDLIVSLRKDVNATRNPLFRWVLFHEALQDTVELDSITLLRFIFRRNKDLYDSLANKLGE
jgi:hypothetical protein